MQVDSEKTHFGKQCEGHIICMHANTNILTHVHTCEHTRTHM